MSSIWNALQFAVISYGDNDIFVVEIPRSAKQQIRGSKVKVIFIASLSHSGSTLLDLMLNAHPELVSVGELKQLSRFARFSKPKQPRCTCGTLSLWDCDFWKSVNDVTK